jgi:secretion/DNA translocation related TadE-like protein
MSGASVVKLWVIQRTLRDETGAGAVLAVGIVGAVVLVLIAELALGAAVVTRQRIIGAVDAAALAAADGASGAVAGAPCDLAARVATAGGATLTACSIDGLVATVTVTGGSGMLPFGARSTAGPPP